jgi:ectoine hydroxylase-related dioxygenase (phytanoyl-CoA dioxygenase family)
MLTNDEKAFFLEHGYFHAKGVLSPEYLAHIRAEFDRIWDLPGRNSQHKLLQRRSMIDLIEHPPILDRHRAIFGDQTQLLQYDFLRQGPKSDFPLRSWHRDFSVPGDLPLTINTILYLDDMTPEKGPTYVVPGTHRGPALPPKDKIGDPLPGEIGVLADAGDAVFINSAIWHSGSRNASDGLRRGIYLYYGYWWIKRYESEQALPYQAFEGATEQRLRLLGVKMPQGDIHMYDPTKGFPE